MADAPPPQAPIVEDESRASAARPTASGLLRSVGAPYPPYLGLVVRDSIIVWVLVRATFAVAFAIVGLGGVARHPPWTIHAALIGVTALLIWIDRRRRHELLLPANLGARGIWFWCASLVGATVMDAVTHVAFALR